MIIDGRKMLNYSNKELTNMLTGEFKIKIDDGVFETNEHLANVNIYFWNLHRRYPKTPLIRNHVLFVDGNTEINNKIISAHIEKIYWDVVETYELRTPRLREPLNKLVYETISEFYNDVIILCKEYVTSIDITDFTNLYKNERIAEQINNLTVHTKNFGSIYNVYNDVLRNDRSLDGNNIAKAVRSGSVNQNQVNQCIGPRGIVSEIDLSILPRPVLSGFASGMKSLYDGLAEGRTAAKSLYFNSAKIGDTEYTARRIQILTMIVERLYANTDCGSTRYINWQLTPPHMKEDSSKWSGDLEYMEGKYYLCEETKTLKMLTKKDTHLYGKTIKLRTAMFCQHEDPHGICEVCFGGLSNNLNPNTHLGHACAATMSQQQTQSILSTKHLDSSSNGSALVFKGNLAKYFHSLDDVKLIMMNNQVKIHIPREIFASIIDIEVVENIQDLNNRSIAEIEYFLVEDEEDNIDKVTVGAKSKVMFTYEMLEYIKEYYESNVTMEEEVIIIDMKDFYVSNPVFEVIQKQYSYSDHANDVSKIIESKMSDIMDRRKPDSPDTTLMELFQVINSKLNVNIAIIEVLLYATMTYDHDDYRLARGSSTPCLGVASDTIAKRSASAKLLLQGQQHSLIDCGNFYKGTKPDSIFDIYFKPLEVIESYRKKFKDKDIHW